MVPDDYCRNIPTATGVSGEAALGVYPALGAARKRLSLLERPREYRK
jgi:hypothetical protein